ncbi:hypothetical protein HIM_09742 [Hirsutella minnesotensis 3608]|uniref:Peptidase S33 tripeptidyl aminopeptidase-like C-terminal domain-containing protein n=1 Tax=Hirsutella minnesotensis 3608 TaxID=1043627 RepID=A0A0F7ZXK4_9HYPO|nr:hypothetical protein HIM_09742 [Hirsutella minnesotensis 3608]
MTIRHESMKNLYEYEEGVVTIKADMDNQKGLGRIVNYRLLKEERKKKRNYRKEEAVYIHNENVGRMVLDGVLDHSQSSAYSLLTEAVASENTLEEFFKWCKDAAACRLREVKDLGPFYDGLVDAANREPIPAPGCLHGSDEDAVTTRATPCRPDVTGYEMIRNSLDFIADPPRWAELSLALQQAHQGNATLLSSALHRPGSSPLPGHSSSFSHRAISCQDWTHGAGDRQATDLMAELIAARALAPHTRGINEMLDIKTDCVGWPAPVRNPQQRLGREQLAKVPSILLVSSLHDSSTSIAWAIGMREQVPSAVSIFRNGSGHTSYDSYGETQKAVDAYFVKDVMPDDLSIFAT